MAQYGNRGGDPEYLDSALAWQPLAVTAPRMLGPGLEDRGILKIGAFGTCGNRNAPGYVSWRHTELFPILAQYGINPDKVFNPEMEKWRPEDAEIESIHFARDEVVAVAVTNQTESPAGITEVGLGALSGVLRGQDVVIYMAEDKNSPPATRQARQLGKSILADTAARYPLFEIVDSVTDLCHVAAARLLDRIAQRDSGLVVPAERRILPPRRTDLNPAVFLSGTCGPEKPEWMKKVEGEISGRSIPVRASYSKNWDPAEERLQKANDAVLLVAITGETESFGAQAEFGALALQALLAGQSLAVLIEDHPSGPESPTNRSRTLLRAHLDRLCADFPELPIFVAQDLDQLVIFGLSEYYEQRQRLQRS